METTYQITIILTLIGFVSLALILLVPVYLFLRREQAKGDAWNEELRRQGMLPAEPEVREPVPDRTA